MTAFEVRLNGVKQYGGPDCPRSRSHFSMYCLTVVLIPIRRSLLPLPDTWSRRVLKSISEISSSASSVRRRPHPIPVAIIAASRMPLTDPSATQLRRICFISVLVRQLGDRLYSPRNCGILAIAVYCFSEIS